MQLKKFMISHHLVSMVEEYTGRNDLLLWVTLVLLDELLLFVFLNLPVVCRDQSTESFLYVIFLSCMAGIGAEN